jgi:hypothetical protein
MDREHGRFPLKSLTLLFGRVVVPAARRKVEAAKANITRVLLTRALLRAYDA